MLGQGGLDMKHNRAASTFGKLFLAFSFLFGIAVWTSAPAQAQSPWWQNDQYSREREREYRREQRRREREARRAQRRQNRDYGNNGYDYGNNGYGNNGYGYGNNGDRPGDGYRNYGGSFDLRQTALNAGANEGLKEGRRDRDRGDRFDYRDEEKYREATTDYSSRLGDRSTYQRYFRDAFVTGYTEGYRGY